MDIWNVVLDIVKILVPSLIMFFVTYSMLKFFFESENSKRMLEIRTKNMELLTPIRLQAYERLVLLLERISPNSLVVRINKPGMSATQLKAELISNINDEFAHNISQQVYVSLQAWSIVRAVKEEMVNLINATYAGLDVNTATSLDLARALFERIIQKEEIPTQKAIDFLKKELQIVFEQ